MADYLISIDAAGSSKDNERDRSISGLFPYTGGTYKTISHLTRRGGIWCNCGGTSQSVTLTVYDQLITGSTVIKTSDTVTCKCYGSGPSSDNYAQTTFSDWTQAQSNAATAAWAAGTLIIRRFVTIKAYTSSKHGSPVFRDGYYSDVIAIQGSTVPFTQYRPEIVKFDIFRSDDGVNENLESTTVYAKIRLAMNDSTGLADAPQLRVYYAQDRDPDSTSSYLDIGSAFGLIAENLNVDKTVRLTGTWSNGEDYYFKLYFSAGYEVTESKPDMAQRMAIPIYISENNSGVSIGQYSTATKDEPKFESRWPAYLYGGIAQIGDGSQNVFEVMGVQAGSVEGRTSTSGKTEEYDVVFSKAYAAAPVVVIGMQLGGALADSYYAGRLSCALISVSATGFKVRTYNYTASGDAVNIGFTWAAFGRIAKEET